MHEEKAYLHSFFQKTVLWASGFGLDTKDGQSLPSSSCSSESREDTCGRVNK